MRINYCGYCGKKLKVMVMNTRKKFLMCKKCIKYYPYEEEFIKINIKSESNKKSLQGEKK